MEDIPMGCQNGTGRLGNSSGSTPALCPWEKTPRFVSAPRTAEPKADSHGFKPFRDFTFSILERFESLGRFVGSFHLQLWTRIGAVNPDWNAAFRLQRPGKRAILQPEGCVPGWKFMEREHLQFFDVSCGHEPEMRNRLEINDCIFRFMGRGGGREKRADRSGGRTAHNGPQAPAISRAFLFGLVHFAARN